MKVLIENAELQLPVSSETRAFYDVLYPIFGGTQGRWMIGDYDYLLPLPDELAGYAYIAATNLTELSPDTVLTTMDAVKAWKDVYLAQVGKVRLDTEARVEVRNVRVNYYELQEEGTEFYLLLPSDMVEISLNGINYDFTSVDSGGLFFLALPTSAAKAIPFYKDYAYELDIADLRQFIRVPKVTFRMQDVQFTLPERKGIPTFVETRFFVYPQPTGIGALLSSAFPSPCEVNSHYLTPVHKALWNLISSTTPTSFRELELWYLMTRCFLRFETSDSPIYQGSTLFMLGVIPTAGEWDLSGLQAGYFDLIPYAYVPFVDTENPVPLNSSVVQSSGFPVKSCLITIGLFRTLGIYLSKEATPMPPDDKYLPKPLYYGGFLKVLRENIPSPEGILYVGYSSTVYNLLKLANSPIFPYKLKEKPKIDPFPFVGVSFEDKPDFVSITLPGEIPPSNVGISIPIDTSTEFAELPETWPVFVLDSNNKTTLVSKKEVSNYAAVVGPYAENPAFAGGEISLSWGL
jgi:hypothetical protein